MFSALHSAWQNRKSDTSGFLLFIFFIGIGIFTGILLNPDHEGFESAATKFGCALIVLAIMTELLARYDKRSLGGLGDGLLIGTVIAILVASVLLGGLAGLLISQFLL